MILSLANFWRRFSHLDVMWIFTGLRERFRSGKNGMSDASGIAGTAARPRRRVLSTSQVAPADVLRSVRRIELRTRRLVDSHFIGEYRSLFKGQGMEFAEVREYQAGDEVRTIDWNVTARMGRPFVKRYIEERELTVMMVIDVSASSVFGTGNRFRDETAIEMAAVLGLSAARNNDRVGMLLFSDRVERFLPPRKGRKHVLRMIRDLLLREVEGTATSFAAITDPLLRALPHRSIIFVFSDFYSDDYETPLARLSQKHDVIAVTIGDPVEQQLPDIGRAWFEDPESGDRLVVDTSDTHLREMFRERAAAMATERNRVFTGLSIDSISVSTGESWVDALLSFFRTRSRRVHGAVRKSVRASVTTAGRRGSKGIRPLRAGS